MSLKLAKSIIQRYSSSRVDVGVTSLLIASIRNTKSTIQRYYSSRVNVVRKVHRLYNTKIQNRRVDVGVTNLL